MTIPSSQRQYRIPHKAKRRPNSGVLGALRRRPPATFASYGLTPFQVGRHWLSVAASICRLGTGLTVDPGISPGHGPRTTDLGSRILDVRCQSLESDIQDPISKIVSYKGLTGCHRRSGIGPKSPVCNLQSTVNLGLPTAYR